MEVSYFKEYSHSLCRDMEFKLYGSRGPVCIYFPCQNGRFFDFENFGMTDTLRPLIDGGKIRFLTVDSMDAESLSAGHLHPHDRLEVLERYYHYITDELVPRIPQICFFVPGVDRLMTMGFSMGAYHAATLYFRRPDLFSAGLCLSGVYRIGWIMDYMDPLAYDNSPADFLQGMPEDHPWMGLYARGRLVICCGRGAWEHPMLESTEEIRRVLAEKHIPAWVDIWGNDVAHDWYWWKKQSLYFLPYLLDPKGGAA